MGVLVASVRVANTGSRGHEVHLVILIAAYVVVLVGSRLKARLTGHGHRTLDSPQRLSTPTDRRVTFVAAASIVSAVVHLIVSPEHFREDWTYGAFFLVLASLQLLWSLLLLRRPSPRLLQVGAGAMMLLLMLWAETRLVGLGFGPVHPGREAAGPYDVFAGLVEVALIGVALSTPTFWSRHPRDQGTSTENPGEPAQRRRRPPDDIGSGATLSGPGGRVRLGDESRFTTAGRRSPSRRRIR